MVPRNYRDRKLSPDRVDISRIDNLFTGADFHTGQHFSSSDPAHDPIVYFLLQEKSSSYPAGSHYLLLLLKQVSRKAWIYCFSPEL